jgi:pimeloyl-ACP methyl ester carboxylesterase
MRGSYTTADHCHDARMAALRLGWDRFSLMGHSMGGGICACLAGTIPDKIKRLVILEITGQGGSNPQHAPVMLGRAIHLLSVRHGLAQRSAQRKRQQQQQTEKEKGATTTTKGGGAAAGGGKESSLLEQFQDAAASAKTLSDLNGKQKLQMYGLFKQAQTGAKTASFEQFFCRNDHFTKTGSG